MQKMFMNYITLKTEHKKLNISVISKITLMFHFMNVQTI